MFPGFADRNTASGQDVCATVRAPTAASGPPPASARGPPGVRATVIRAARRPPSRRTPSPRRCRKPWRLRADAAGGHECVLLRLLGGGTAPASAVPRLTCAFARGVKIRSYGRRRASYREPTGPGRRPGAELSAAAIRGYAAGPAVWRRPTRAPRYDVRGWTHGVRPRFRTPRSSTPRFRTRRIPRARRIPCAPIPVRADPRTCRWVRRPPTLPRPSLPPPPRSPRPAWPSRPPAAPTPHVRNPS